MQYSYTENSKLLETWGFFTDNNKAIALLAEKNFTAYKLARRIYELFISLGKKEIFPEFCLLCENKSLKGINLVMHAIAFDTNLEMVNQIFDREILKINDKN